jgi:probable rRNA maturation factor
MGETSQPESEPRVLFRRAPKALDRAALEEFARRLETDVAGGSGFSCMIAGDGELRRLNRQFRGKDEATDVLSFPEPPALGEIAISAVRAARQAREFGHDLETEVRILMLHGLLHLMGMDHERDRGRMRRAEAAWRRKLGLPSGLIERARA